MPIDVAFRSLPEFGEAYWSLANLKTFRFTADEMRAMEAQLAGGRLSDEDRFHFHFALGKALEDVGQFGPAFEHYALGNEQRRAGLSYRADQTSSLLRQSKELFTPAFFESRSDFGSSAADPIFIVGLPRAGSTLIEQILASHSMVEGTMELPNILNAARALSDKKLRTDTSRVSGRAGAIERRRVP